MVKWVARHRRLAAGRRSYPNRRKEASMRRVVLFGLALGVGSLLASALPDIKRYIKISLM